MNIRYNGIGEKCKKYREETLKMQQKEVAEQTGYSRSEVCNFEKGKRFSYNIMLWYILHGMDIKREDVVNGEK